MQKIKLGIIGLGRMGKKHAENIHYRIPNAELIAVSSVIQEELDQIKNEIEPKYIYKDYKELLQNKEIDGVIIATDSQSHSKIIIEAYQSGLKHIFTEKPMGMTLDEINKIQNIIGKDTKMIFQVGYNRRFDKSYQIVKEKIEEGFIGKPILIKMINRDPAKMADFIVNYSPTSGGLILDMLTHDYDLVRWLTDSDAKTIYGVGGVYAYEGLKKVNDMDNCGILVQLKNDTMAWFETSRNCSYGYHVETEIFGTTGCLRISTTPAKDRVIYLDKNGINQKCYEWFFEYWEPTFLAEIEHFVHCIINNKKPLVSLEDGYKTVSWAFAANEAVKEHKILTLD